MSNHLNYDDPIFRKFNESLDEEDVIIAGVVFRPSKILHELDPAAYTQALNDFLEQDYVALKQIVFDDFPANVAFNFRLSEKGLGSSDPVKKLLHLKDTWESIIYIVYALVMGEIRRKNINCSSSRIVTGNDTSGAPVLKPLNLGYLFSNSLKQRLTNVRGIVEYLKANSIGLKSEEISFNLCDLLARLIDIRNDISHHSTPTREQAEDELRLVAPIFQEMLEESRFLERCKVLRFESFSAQCRCEVFNGHALNREYDKFPLLTPDQLSYIIGLGQEQIFVIWDDECFSLSPFLHFCGDTTGHESYLCVYKEKKAGKYWFEPVKTRIEREFSHLHSRLEAEKDALLALVVP
jgi:hypothetical protein